MDTLEMIEGLAAFAMVQTSPILIAIWTFLNTSFSAALFGALAGALSAHTIAMRSERRKSLREEIAGVNNAIALANSIANTFVAMKRQHVMAMAALYKRSFDSFLAVRVNPPAVPTEFSFITDYRVLRAPLTSIVELRQTLLNRVQSSGSAISMSVPLHQSIHGLENALSGREEIIELLRAKTNDFDRANMYFGLPTQDGHIDERYADQMTAIISYVDDGIYFPMLICEILTAHGQKLAIAFGRNAPKVSTVTYKKVSEAGLLPDPSNYPDFEQTFRSPTNSKPLTRFARFKHWSRSLVSATG